MATGSWSSSWRSCRSRRGAFGAFPRLRRHGKVLFRCKRPEHTGDFGRLRVHVRFDAASRPGLPRFRGGCPSPFTFPGGAPLKLHPITMSPGWRVLPSPGSFASSFDWSTYGETDLSTEQTRPQAPAWLSRAHADAWRREGHRASSRQGPQASLGLAAGWPLRRILNPVSCRSGRRRRDGRNAQKKSGISEA